MHNLTHISRFLPLLLYALAAAYSHGALSVITLPSSSRPLYLQTLSGSETTFLLPPNATISTTQGTGIQGDSSRNWALILQGVVDAAESGIALSSPPAGMSTIDVFGRVTSRSTNATEGGVVLLNSGTVVNHTDAAIIGNSGIILPSNSQVENYGAVTGTGGNAIVLNGSGNRLFLNSGSLINGALVSAGNNNTLVLSGIGKTDADIGGPAGFSSVVVDGSDWKVGGSVLLSSQPGAALRITRGGFLLFPGTLSSLNNATASVVIEDAGSLQIGTGGNSGDIAIPIHNDGLVTFYRSDSVLNLRMPLAGAGVVFLRGTGVRGQSSYTMNTENNAFTGNIIIGNGARLQSNSQNPAPSAHILVNEGGTLWMGSSAKFTSAIFVEGNGWLENLGQLGALRLDSGANAAGSVTLTGNTRMTAVFSDYTGTISGVIDDGDNHFQLEKSGDGLITLSGNNRWSGGLLLSAGRLAVSADQNLGDPQGILTFNGGRLEATRDFISNRAIAVTSSGGSFYSSGVNTFAGGARGSGNLTVGSGALVLAGQDTRTGSTTINPGSALQIGSDSINGASTGTLSGSVNNAGSLIFNRAGNSAYAGALSGSGTLIKRNTGLVTVTGDGSSQRSVRVESGTLRFAPANRFQVSDSLITAGGATTSVAGASQVNVAGTLVQQPNAIFEASLDATRPAATASTFSLAGTLNLSGAPGSASAITRKLLTVLQSPNPAGISGDFTAFGLSNPADYLVVSGAKANNDSDYIVAFGLRWLMGLEQGNGTFTLLNPQDIFNVDVALEDQSGPFASGWDGASLTKAGAGTLVLSRQNTFTGNTVINGGVLQTDSENAIAQSANVSVNPGATLNLNNFSQRLSHLSGAGAITLGSATMTVNNTVDSVFNGPISGSGSVLKTGVASLTLGGENTFSGGLRIDAGTTVVKRGAALGAGPVVNNATLSLDLASASVLRNLFSGNGVLNKDGAGIALLTQSGSSAGDININNGALAFGQGVTFNSRGDVTTAPSATAVFNAGASLQVDGNFAQQGALDVVLSATEPTISASTASLGNNASLNIVGVNFPDDIFSFENRAVIQTTSPGALLGDFSRLRIGGASSAVDYASVTGYKDVLSRKYSVDFLLSWYAARSDTPERAHGTFTLPNPEERFELNTPLINQPASAATGWDGTTLTKAGEGTLILSRRNFYTGPTLLNDGILQAGIENALARSSALRIASGAAFILDGYDQTVNNLSGDGNILLGDAQLTLNNSSDTRFAGVISGNGAVEKTGANTLQLTSDQTWPGPTTINSGTLILGNGPDETATLASAQVAIAPGAILGGYGGTGGDIINQGTLAIADALPQFADGPAGNFNVGGNLVNSGNIVMASPWPASTLTVAGNYTGNNGLVTLSTVLGGDDSPTDRLVIGGDSRGNTQLKINNSGGQGALTQQGIEVISVAGQSTGVFTLAERVVAGSYEYFLQQGLPTAPNGNWYLRSQLPVPPSPTPPQPPQPAAPIVRPEAGSYLANLATAQQLFAQQLSDRSGKADNSSLWLRQNGMRRSGYDNSGQLKTTANSYLIQGGGEVLAGQFTRDDSLRIGVMLGYGTAQNHTRSGRSDFRSQGKIDGYSAGIYGTWYQDATRQQGLYVDSWLQYSWLDAHVKGDDLPQEHYRLNGLSGSLETGYRWDIVDDDSGAVALTPQAQVIWSGIDANDHRESSGTRVTSTADNPLQTRLGIALSHHGAASRDNVRGKTFTTYVAANWLHNTSLSTVAMNDDHVGFAGERNRGEIRLGINGNLSPQWDVWGTIAQQMGDSGYHATTGGLGARYRF